MLPEPNAAGAVTRHRRETRPVPPPLWMTDGACVGTDPEAYFPLDEDGPAAEPARRVCAECPLRQRCADYAIATGMGAGIWGGLSTLEREQLTRARRSASRGAQ
jgi:WhiB family redox-sensing transcriptional regulator